MATTAEHGITGALESPASAPSGEAPAPVVREVSILDILLVLARRKRFILWTTAIFTIVGLVASSVMTPSYTANTVILPPQSSSASSSLSAGLSSLGALGGLAGGGLGIKNPSDMYVALFKSETVENALIQEFDLQRQYKQKYLSTTRKAFEGHSKVAADTKSGLITISFTDHDPKRAATIANSYVAAYRRLSEHLAISEAAQRRLFFEQQLEQTKNSLADAEEALVKTQQKTGLVSLDSQARALIESAASVRAQITAKEVQIQGMETYAAPDNAGLVEAQKELAGLQDQLNKLGGNANLDQNGLLVPKGQVPTASLEYARRLRDVKYYETIFNILARQFEMAKLDEAKEGAVVQVVDAAAVPDYKSAPKRSLWTAGAFVLGFLISAGTVLWKAALRFLHEDPETDGKLRALRTTLRPGRQKA